MRIPTAMEMDIQERQAWAALPEDIRNKAIGLLVEELPRELLERVYSARVAGGVEWMREIGKDVDGPYSFHFYEGMGVRNLLRSVILDGELPTGNWDDYYCQALLRAAAEVIHGDEEST